MVCMLQLDAFKSFPLAKPMHEQVRACPAGWGKCAGIEKTAMYATSAASFSHLSVVLPALTLPCVVAWYYGERHINFVIQNDTR